MFDYSFAEHDQVCMTSCCMFDINQMNSLQAWTKTRRDKYPVMCYNNIYVWLCVCGAEPMLYDKLLRVWHKLIFCRPGPRLVEVFDDNDVFSTQSLKGNLTAFVSAREKGFDGLIRSLCSRFAGMEEGVQSWKRPRSTVCRTGRTPMTLVVSTILGEIFSWQNHIK